MFTNPRFTASTATPDVDPKILPALFKRVEELEKASGYIIELTEEAEGLEQ